MKRAAIVMKRTRWGLEPDVVFIGPNYLKDSHKYIKEKSEDPSNNPRIRYTAVLKEATNDRD